MQSFAENNKLDNDIDEQWLLYRRTGDIEIRNSLVLKYMDIVKKIAFKLYRGSWNLESADELVNEGIVALISAIDRFDIDRNIKFETFVSRRVQGAMFDYMRKQNGFVRTLHETKKQITEVEESLQRTLGRAPTDEEIADSLDISVQEFKKLQQKIQPIKVVSLNQPEHGDSYYIDVAGNLDENPAIAVEKDEYNETLVEGINKLSFEQQMVISLFYKEDFSVREISDVMKIPPEKVSQLRFQAIKKLKGYIESNKIRG